MKKWKMTKGTTVWEENEPRRVFEEIEEFESLGDAKKAFEEKLSSLESDFEIKKRGEIAAQILKDGEPQFTLCIWEEPDKDGKWEIIKGYNVFREDGEIARKFDSLGVFDTYEEGKTRVHEMFDEFSKECEVDTRGNEKVRGQIKKDGKVLFTIALCRKD